MIIVCSGCNAKYKFDEAKLGDRPRAKTKCARCGGVIEIENPLLAALTLPPTEFETPPVPEPPSEPDEPDEATEPGPSEPPKTVRKRSAAEMGNATITGRDMHRMGLLELPRDKRFSIAVIQGAATGQIFPITKTRVTIGRSGNDINLEDPEASRQHAVVEIYGERVILRDLGSTNGTFIEVERVEHADLANHTEFRIGTHVLMLIITDVE